MTREFRFFDEKMGSVRGFVPDGYTGAWTVVYVHGHGVDVNEAWTKHELPKQFLESGLKALFLAVEAPANGQQSVFVPDLPSLLLAVTKNTSIVPPSKVVAIGHSGAYRTLTHWVDYDHLKQIILLDGLFGGVVPFAKYVLSGGKLTIIATDRTSENSALLAKKVDVEYTKVNEDHMGLVTSGRYIPPLLKRSVAAGGGPLGFFLLLAAGLWVLR